MTEQQVDIYVYHIRETSLNHSGKTIATKIYGTNITAKVRKFNANDASRASCGPTAYTQITNGTNGDVITDGKATIFMAGGTHKSADLIREITNSAITVYDWWGTNGASQQYSIKTAVGEGYVASSWYNGTTLKADIAIQQCVRALVKAVKSAMDEDEFTRHSSSNSPSSINLIRYEGTSPPGSQQAYITDIFAISTPNLMAIKRATKFRVFYQDGSGSANYYTTYTYTSTDIRGQSGFFYGAGYYDEQQVGQYDYSATPHLNNNDFIRVKIETTPSGWSMTKSNISNTIETIQGDGKYYRLYNQTAVDGGNEPYYVETTAGGQGTSGGSSGGSSTQPIQINLPTFEPFNLADIDYSTAAETDISKYIYDFDKYKVNFIPCTGVSADLMDAVNMAVATFKTNEGTTSVNPVTNARVKISTFTTPEQDMFAILDTYNNNMTIQLEIIAKDSSTVPQTLTLSQYFADEGNRGKYAFNYYQVNGTEREILNIDFQEYLSLANNELKHIDNEDEVGYTFKAEMSLNQEAGQMNIRSFELFEAFTRGRDFIEENYTIVRPQEKSDKSIETSRYMEYDDNYFTYKYSGRDIDIFCKREDEDLCTLEQDYSSTTIEQEVYCALIHSADLLLESDVTLGETYGEQKYFIEAVKTPIWEDDTAEIKESSGTYNYTDTFKMIDYLKDGIDPTLYTDADIEVINAKIDLRRCKYYSPLEATFENDWCDCSYNSEVASRECIYQKLGYCPYRFESEKHPRRIRSLRKSKSNRFNLIQELSKTFKIYPYFYIEHEKNGKVKLDENGNMIKHVFFMTEKGNTNAMGFRYEKNLRNITRTIDSAAITTKLYVESVDSNYMEDGLCSIQTAIDNISRNSYILDFSYYVDMGMLDADMVQRDLYGIDENDFAFLPRIGKFNKQYDDYSDLIISMTGKTLNELEAEIIVSTTGVTTSLEERKKIAQQMYQFKASSSTINSSISSRLTTTAPIDYKTSDTYKNYLTKFREQATILWGLIEKLFYSDNYFSMPIKKDNGEYEFYVLNYNEDDSGQSFSNIFNAYRKKYCKGELFWRLVIEGFNDEDYVPVFDHWEDCMEEIVNTKRYEVNGKLGKYRSLYNEVQYWKRERAKILNKINDLSKQFYEKYEPYLKEGTFTDSNFLTDNEYYWGGVSVLADSCKPKLTYTFQVVDISPLPEYEGYYDFDLADTTFVEDIDFFGINKYSGLPNRQKVLITDITEELDTPNKNSIGVKNYTSSFDDLFSSITASVQSLTFNENVYKRASNFTAKQYITTESLQDTLDIGDLTLLDTAKKNIQLDEEGTEGNDINNTASQYKQTGEGIFFSTDGGETWDLGIGPKGINMDYAKFGNLDASKIQIVDGEYIYFLWDKDGINAYRDPATSTEGLLDFARFNRYGLSLIEKGNVRLRAGYEYRSNEFGSNETGDYQKEIPLKDQNVGFYLYNESGQPIFKTETQSSYNDNTADYSARLSLTGEMFVTNQILNSGPSGINSNIKYERKLSVLYTFKEETNISVYTGQAGSVLQENYEKLLLFNNNFATGDFLLLDSNNQTPTRITFNEPYHFYQIVAFYDSPLVGYPNAKTIEVRFYEDCTFYTPDASQTEDTDFDAQNFLANPNIESILTGDAFEIIDSQNNTVIVKFSMPTPDTGKYEINIDNSTLQILITNTLKVIDNIDENATHLTEDQRVQQQEISYYENEGGLMVLKTISLYVYNENGNITYWRNYNKTKNQIGTLVGDFSLAEVGVFINNKRSLKVSTNKAVDNTNLDSQRISGDADQTAEAINAILSGAERTFTITAGGTDQDGNFVYRNVLSVLKNGVLYMGGTITDFYGKALDISSLSYLPDEVRINDPAFILTNAGQIWCDWDNFFGIVDKDGTKGFTTTSLKSVLDGYNESLNILAQSITDYFTALSSMSFYGGSSNGYYITDPSAT